jgi:hypothetical protein
MASFWQAEIKRLRRRVQELEDDRNHDEDDDSVANDDDDDDDDDGDRDAKAAARRQHKAQEKRSRMERAAAEASDETLGLQVVTAKSLPRRGKNGDEDDDDDASSTTSSSSKTADEKRPRGYFTPRVKGDSSSSAAAATKDFVRSPSSAVLANAMNGLADSLSRLAQVGRRGEGGSATGTPRNHKEFSTYVTLPFSLFLSWTCMSVEKLYSTSTGMCVKMSVVCI